MQDSTKDLALPLAGHAQHHTAVVPVEYTCVECHVKLLTHNTTETAAGNSSVPSCFIAINSALTLSACTQ